MILKRPLWIRAASYYFAFAISSPIGVGIVIAIDATTLGRTADWMSAKSMSINCIACGVLFYFAINHLMSKGSPLKKRTIKTWTPSKQKWQMKISMKKQIANCKYITQKDHFWQYVLLIKPWVLFEALFRCIKNKTIKGKNKLEWCQYLITPN